MLRPNISKVDFSFYTSSTTLEEMKRLTRVAGIIGIFTLLVGLVWPIISVNASTETENMIVQNLTAVQPLGTLSSTPPTIDKPDWYFKTVVYYTVAKNGTIVSDLNEFATLAHQTLNDSRGWSQLGVRFEPVTSGGTLNLILSQASLVPSYSSACSASWSCRVGNNVIINDDRWAGASSSWNAAGGSLRDYRHMVINHETGHWLGHSHQTCSATGALAPVMQQQSIDLGGCVFNPWPLNSELWTTRF